MVWSKCKLALPQLSSVHPLLSVAVVVTRCGLVIQNLGGKRQPYDLDKIGCPRCVVLLVSYVHLLLSDTQAPTDELSGWQRQQGIWLIASVPLQANSSYMTCFCTPSMLCLPTNVQLPHMNVLCDNNPNLCCYSAG